MTQLPTYRSVMVPTDLSERAAQAFPHACALVAPGGTIHLVNVLEWPELPNPMYAHYGPPTPTPEEQARAKREAEARLAELASSCALPSDVVVRRHVLEQSAGHVVDRLCQVARELEADVLCIASHGRRGLGRVLLGSVAEGVLRRCPVPTLIVRIPEHELRSE